MSKSIVDLVFVVDASHSMKPCFDALVSHLDKILQPLQDTASSIRYGLVAHAAGAKGGEAVYDHTFLCGSGPESMAKLYSPQVSDSDFFTTDSGKFKRALSEVKCAGNEEMLIALDVALDFPFGPLDSHKRVIAVFSDEPLEAGLEEGKHNEKISALTEKIHARKVKLFMAMPGGDGMDELSMVDKSEIEEVSAGHGLAGVDFSKLLMQMGKSISGSSLQVVNEPAYQTAIFGQDSWDLSGRVVSLSNRDVVLGIGESTLLSTENPITNLNVRMVWTLGDTFLDIHLFYLREASSQPNRVGYDCRENPDGIDLSLDPDLTMKNKSFDLSIQKLSGLSFILIAANIWNRGSDAKWSDYDGLLSFRTNNGEHVKVPLTSDKCGAWCVIAAIDNRDSNLPKISNINHVCAKEPKLSSYL